MEKQHKLADLKLVAKHFPVSNYSYPRGDPSQYQRERQRPQNATTDGHSSWGSNGSNSSRSSRGSNSSVPSMVEDHGSDDDGGGEEELQYHVTGAEIWDSFWICQEDGAGVKSPKYPALIKQPATLPNTPNNKPHTLAESQGSPRPRQGQPERESPTPTAGAEWPLPANLPCQRPRTPKNGAKASYSLFPVAPTAKPSSRPSRPCTPKGDGRPLQSVSASEMNVPPLGKQKKPAPLDLSSAKADRLPISAAGPTPPSSNPTSPATSAPLPALEQPQEPSRTPGKPHSRRPSLAGLRKGHGSKLSKSMPANSYLAMAQSHKSDSHLPSTLYRHPDPKAVPPLPPAPHTAPLPQTRTIPRRPSRPDISDIPPMPPIPPDSAQSASPPRISFWLDSDSESDDADEESRSLARRILGGLAGHNRSDRDRDRDRDARDAKGHKRSVSDGRGASKTTPTRRGRADTTGEAIAQRPVALVADVEAKKLEKEKEREREREKEREREREKGRERERERERDRAKSRERGREREKERTDRPRPRRQGSEVFGRIMGRKTR